MPIEIAAGFRLLRSCELAPVLGLTMGKTIGVGAQIVLPLFGSLAGDSKLDQFSHAAPDGNRIRMVSGAGLNPCIAGKKIADALAAGRLPVSWRATP